MNQLDDATRQQLSIQADLDLARRSLSASPCHFVLLLVIVVFTPYLHEHPVVIWTTGSVLLFLGVARLRLGLLFPSKRADNPNLWKQMFRAGAYAAAIAWGTFVCLTMTFYGQQWIGWFVLLVTSGIAAGASTSLSPDESLYRNYALILMGPTILWGVFRGGMNGYTVAVTVAVYLTYLLVQGREQSRSYWGAVTDSALLKTRTSELEERGAHLKSLIEESPLGIVVLDIHHHVQMANRAFEELFLYKQHEIVGVSLENLLQTDELAPEMNNFVQLVEAGKTVHAVTRRRRKDETLVDVELHAVPLMLEGKLIGIYALYQEITDRKRAQTQLQEANLKLAEQVQELQRRSSEIALLSEMGNWLQACQTVDEAYGVIGIAAQRLFAEWSGALYVQSSSGNLVDMVTSWGEPIHGERVFHPQDCWAQRRGQPHRFRMDGINVACKHCGEAHISESLCIPMTAQGAALGILHLQRPRIEAGQQRAVPRQSGEIEQRLAVVLAEQVALALANLNLRERLRYQSVRDPVTGLFNRRYMEESLQREISQATRDQGSVALVRIDVDQFAKLNDTLGHEGGDTLLSALGDFLTKRIGAQDTACRHDGVGFALVLPNASLRATLRLAEMLHKEVKQLKVWYGGRCLEPISLCIGVGIFPDHGLTISDIKRAAELALQRAKPEGRDHAEVET